VRAGRVPPSGAVAGDVDADFHHDIRLHQDHDW
jgi:hypothetical protein